MKFPLSLDSLLFHHAHGMTIFASKEILKHRMNYVLHIRGKLIKERTRILQNASLVAFDLFFSFCFVARTSVVRSVPALVCTEHVPPETKRLFVPCRSRVGGRGCMLQLQTW
jgi:hypothetical protein